MKSRIVNTIRHNGGSRADPKPAHKKRRNPLKVALSVSDELRRNLARTQVMKGDMKISTLVVHILEWYYQEEENTYE